MASWGEKLRAISAILRDDPLWAIAHVEVLNVAVSDRVGSAAFHVNSHTGTHARYAIGTYRASRDYGRYRLFDSHCPSRNDRVRRWTEAIFLAPTHLQVPEWDRSA
jgi:hypothetical protein